MSLPTLPHHSTERILPYEARALFDLVADIESYPRFLPWCKGARVIERLSEHRLLADLIIHYRGVHGKFTSNVILRPEDNEINVELAQGPFKHLHQSWRFTPLGHGEETRVEFDIDFQLRSFILEKMMDIMFESACVKMMHAFTEEAKKRARQKRDDLTV